MNRIVYAFKDFSKKEIVCSGIRFADFVNYLYKPIEHMMILSEESDTALLDTQFDRGFELIEGSGQIAELQKEAPDSVGNFCFVDYCKEGQTFQLKEEQIAELLYLSHMFYPLHDPFFDILQNRFAYLSHDGGWYCKLYCRDFHDFVDVFLGKLIGEKCVASAEIRERVLELLDAGLLAEIPPCGTQKIQLYAVGYTEDMDDLMNHLESKIANAKDTYSLQIQGNSIVGLN